MAPRRIIQKPKKQLAMAIRKDSASTTPNSTPSSSQPSSPRSLLTKEELAEMRRLGKLLPIPMQLKNRHEDPLILINDAANYINHLTATVVARVQKGSLPREVLNALPPQIISPSSSEQNPIYATPKKTKKRLRRRL